MRIVRGLFATPPAIFLRFPGTATTAPVSSSSSEPPYSISISQLMSFMTSEACSFVKPSCDSSDAR